MFKKCLITLSSSGINHITSPLLIEFFLGYNIPLKYFFLVHISGGVNLLIFYLNEYSYTTEYAGHVNITINPIQQKN